MLKIFRELMKPGMRRRIKTYGLLISVIIMTVILEFSMIIIYSSMEKTGEEQRKMSYGGWDAAVYNTDGTVLNRLKTHATVEKSGCMTGMGYVFDGNGNAAGTIGFIDDTAAALGNISALDGRLPMSDGEIAVEMSCLTRLGYSYKLGQHIDITVQRTDENGRMLTEKRSYRLCGVVKNYSGLWIGNENGLLSFFVGGDTGEPLFIHVFFGMKDNFKKYTDELSALTAGHGIFVKNTYTYIDLSVKSEKSGSFVNEDSLPFGVGGPAGGLWMIVLLNVLSAFLMMSILNNSLNERRKSLVLMRCIGASKPQIIKIYTGEILVVLLISIPAGIISGLAVSCFGCMLIKRIFFGELFFYVPVNSLLICVLFLLVFAAITVFFEIMQIFMMPLWGNMRPEIPARHKRKNEKPLDIKNIGRIFSESNRGKTRISFVLSLLTVVILLFSSYDCWVYYDEYCSLKKTYPADYEFGFMLSYFEPLNHMSESEMIGIRSAYGVEDVRAYKISGYLPITWENMRQSRYAAAAAETVFAKYAGKSSVHGTVYGLSAGNRKNVEYYIEEMDEGAFSYGLFSEGKGVILSLPEFYRTRDGEFINGDMPSDKLYTSGEYITESTISPGSTLNIEGENGTVSVTVMGIIYGFDEFTAQAFLNKPYSIIGSYDLCDKIAKGGHQTYEYVQITGSSSANYRQTDVELSAIKTELNFENLRAVKEEKLNQTVMYFISALLTGFIAVMIFTMIEKIGSEAKIRAEKYRNRILYLTGMPLKNIMKIYLYQMLKRETAAVGLGIFILFGSKFYSCYKADESTVGKNIFYIVKNIYDTCFIRFPFILLLLFAVVYIAIKISVLKYPADKISDNDFL